MLKTLLFIETVEILPSELDRNPYELAVTRLQEQLSKKKNIQQIKSFKQRDIAEVIRGRGSLYFHFDVDAYIFDPQEGQVMQARLVDVVPLGVVLVANNMRCIVPETLLCATGSKTFDVKMKTLLLDNKKVTLGSMVQIKLLKIRKIERDGHEEREAIADIIQVSLHDDV